MKILLKRLTLRNFKGIKTFETDFDPRETFIRGANATGKTTLMDGWLFLLFGKDSDDRKDFNIKTLDGNGDPLHYLDHEVEALLQVDDQAMTLKRVFKEKWVKQRGSAEATMQGHESTFFVNGVPVTMREYQGKIDTLICPESTFKILTNPLYFPSLPWQEQRGMLFKMAGDVSDKDIKLTKEMIEMMSGLRGKTVEEYKREIAATKKKIKDQLDVIPARIDEVKRGIPVASNWEALEKSLAEQQDKMKELEARFASESSKLNALGEQRRGLQDTINSKKTRLQAIEFEVRYNANREVEEVKIKHKELTDSILTMTKDMERLEARAAHLANEAASLVTERETLIAQWREINGKTLLFDEGDFMCPTCKRPLDDNDIFEKKQQMEYAFNGNKAIQLEKNVWAGKAIKDRIEHTNAAIKTNAENIAALINQIAETKEQRHRLEEKIPQESPALGQLLRDNNEHVGIYNEIEALQQNLNSIPETIDLSAFHTEKQIIQDKIDGFKMLLADKALIAKAETRTGELLEDQKRLSQELADLEKTEFAIAAYIKAKIEAVEGRVNSKFKIVKFKLFDQQLNGAEVETCTMTIDGVPFADLNSASKIMGGMDVIRSLSTFTNIWAPIWIDNRESTTLIPEMKCQIINLYVDPNYKQLTVINNDTDTTESDTGSAAA
jgi:DNA repair exonuclease SbcCD ATPase subunit